MLGRHFVLMKTWVFLVKSLMTQCIVFAIRSCLMLGMSGVSLLTSLGSG